MAAYTRVPWSKLLQNPRRCCHCWKSDRCLSQLSSAATVETCIPKGQVTIPKKKPRDSLSILKALASTVDQVKGPFYQDVDDPFLMTGKADMFPCFMSKASGQKTARYFINKYGNAFDHEDMAPFVKGFQPDKTEYDHMSLCDDAIRERVQRREVVNAVEVYDKMKQQGMEVSEEVKLELLELMCMFDSTDPPEKTYPLEKVFGFAPEEGQRPATIAQDVFDDLAEKTEDAYNWMLQDSLMTGRVEAAMVVYKEMKEKNVTVYQNTYHLLLKKASMLSFLTKTMIQDTLLSLLREMAEAGMQPNLVTFQSLFHAMFRNPFLFLDCFPHYLAEMRNCGLEPDYKTWCIVMQVMVNCTPTATNKSRRSPTVANVEQIKQYIKDSIHHMKRHPQEIYCLPKGSYFEVAMSLCKYFEDSELAMEVNDFKEYLGTNYIATSVKKESAYYYMLFDLLSKTEPCETIMAIYNKTYGQAWLEQEIFELVLSAVYAFKEYHHLPDLFEDYIQRQARYPNNQVLLSMFTMMSVEGHTEELKITFKEQANHIYSLMKHFFDEQKKPRYTASWRLAVLIIKIFLNAEDLNSAWECFLIYHKNQDHLDHFRWNSQLLPLLTEIVNARDQAKLEKFVTIADVNLNHIVDIDAFRPKLETFMTKEDIDALQRSQKARAKAKYDL